MLPLTSISRSSRPMVLRAVSKNSRILCTFAGIYHPAKSTQPTPRRAEHIASERQAAANMRHAPKLLAVLVDDDLQDLILPPYSAWANNALACIRISLALRSSLT